MLFIGSHLGQFGRMLILEKQKYAAYGSGAVASGIVDNVPTVLLLFFMTDQLKLDPALSGSLIFAIRMLSLGIDPLVGWLGDRVSSAGTRPYIILATGLVGLALSYAGLFIVPALVRPDVAYAAIGLFLLLMTISSSLIAVTHVAMAANSAFDAVATERLVSARSISLMIGFLIGGSCAPLIIEAFGGGIQGYRINAVIVSLIIAATFLPLLGLSKSWPISNQSEVARKSGLRAFRFSTMRALVAANMFQVLALAAIFGALPYIISDYVGAIGLGTFVALLIGAAACSVPLWQRLSSTFRLSGTFMAGGLCFCFGGAVLGFGFDSFGNAALLLSAILCGAGLGSIQFSAYALLAETLDRLAQEDDKVGVAGAIGIWSAAERGTLSLGPLLIGLAMKANGGSTGLATVAVSVAIGAVLISLLPLFHIHRQKRGAR
jgi:glycoside/pentoside/hexuronide:cation symporter, GPH family